MASINGECALFCLQDAIGVSVDVSTTPCGHTFHRSCLLHWKDISLTCPTCRSPLLSALDEKFLREDPDGYLCNAIVIEQYKLAENRTRLIFMKRVIERGHLPIDDVRVRSNVQKVKDKILELEDHLHFLMNQLELYRREKRRRVGELLDSNTATPPQLATTILNPDRVPICTQLTQLDNCVGMIIQPRPRGKADDIIGVDPAFTLPASAPEGPHCGQLCAVKGTPNLIE